MVAAALFLFLLGGDGDDTGDDEGSAEGGGVGSADQSVSVVEQRGVEQRSVEERSGLNLDLWSLDLDLLDLRADWHGAVGQSVVGQAQAVGQTVWVGQQLGVSWGGDGGADQSRKTNE